MGILFRPVLEAETKKKPAEDETEEDVTTDEPEDDSTDYTADVDEEEVDAEPANTDIEDDEEEEPDDTEEDDTTDYTSDAEDDDETTDESLDDSTETEDVAAKDKDKNLKLIDNFIDLYDMIKNILNKLSNGQRCDINSTKITNQVSKNLNVLGEYIHDYILHNFRDNSYVVNLYKYNYFVNALRVNLEILKKINNFSSN